MASKHRKVALTLTFVTLAMLTQGCLDLQVFHFSIW
jgi:hypothetical protein